MGVILALATPATEGAEEGAKTPWQERLPNLHVVRLDDWLVYGDKVLALSMCMSAYMIMRMRMRMYARVCGDGGGTA